jgi:PAS domain S-box-containing protein
MDTKSKKEFEKELLEYHLPTSIPFMRMGFLITLTLFLLYAVLNEILFPGSPMGRFFLRFGIIFPYILASLMAISVKAFRSYLNTILFVIDILTAFGIFIVGATMKPGDLGYDFYYTWAGLVIIGVFTFYRIRFWNLVVVGFTLLLSYILATILNKSYVYSPELFLNQLLFVISMTSIGFFIAYIFEIKNRKDFIQNKELSDHFNVLVNEMREKEAAQAALIRSREKYQTVLNAIPDMIYVTDLEMNVVLVNSALKDWDSKTIQGREMTGRKVPELYKFVDETIFNEEMDYVISTGNIHISEKKYLLNEQEIYIEVRKIPVFLDNKIDQVMVILRDISRKKEVEELKQRNAEQKEVMLREIHHRVKNNLAIVISLLSLQIRKNPNPELKKPMRDIELRIRSMALIHEHLYRSEHLDRIPLANYLHSLASIILGTLSEGNIQLYAELTPTDISIETALPLGLITNELVTNSIKYGFPDHREGKLYITLQPENKDGCLFRLSVKDNGIGLPENFSMENSSSMGMFIIKLLVEQLGAKLEIECKDGACFNIIFKNLVA